ncbi:uncharacterized protein LOC108115729 [Drosophila eugracilis]|uniref:uncharacterized protein LOC108115729 n=1 Tax=Drosophila eugracilis TaxID=29029 RepID=UPI001BD91F20|nr:uncharacterized protein LOC108115729 [Drosophila eugracilis]
MRRSRAPSIRQARKRENEDRDPLNESCSWPSNNETSDWGSSKGSESLGPRELRTGDNPLNESRIFHVLWRNQTTKKHKTWTGNGTLVVTGSVVTLKDDTGKVVDTMTCFKQSDLKENDELEIGSKDVEVQEEIKTLEECVAQRKLEIASWCQKIDARNGNMETSQSPATNTPFRSHVLKKIRRDDNCLEIPNLSTSRFTDLNKTDPIPHEASEFTRKRINEESSLEKDETGFTKTEYLCLLAPADLQKKVLHSLAEHIKSSNVEPSVVKEMVQLVCDHPVLLKTLAEESKFKELIQVIQPQLPPWSEMGLYDSAKFEFVHVMLDHLVVDRSEKCCILANSADCLRLVVGYCQSYNLDHAQLDSLQKVSLFNSLGEEEPMVGLVLSSDLPEIYSLRCKHLIIYNHNAREEANQLLAVGEIDTKIYTPVTSGGCPEQLQFYRRLSQNAHDDSVDDLRNYIDGLIPSTIYELATWTKIEPPYNNDFLEEAAISDSLESIQLVYSRKMRMKT